MVRRASSLATPVRVCGVQPLLTQCMHLLVCRTRTRLWLAAAAGVAARLRAVVQVVARGQALARAPVLALVPRATIESSSESGTRWRCGRTAAVRCVAAASSRVCVWKDARRCGADSRRRCAAGNTETCAICRNELSDRCAWRGGCFRRSSARVAMHCRGLVCQSHRVRARVLAQVPSAS
jgi:hypothetical protein